MAGGERGKPRRHLEPAHKGEATGEETGIGFTEAIAWSATRSALAVTIGTTVFLAALGLRLDVRNLNASFLDTFWVGSILTLALFAGDYFLSAGRRYQSRLHSVDARRRRPRACSRDFSVGAKITNVALGHNRPIF